MDDTFVIQHTEHKKVLQHINSKDNAITFKVGDTRPDGSMQFLDTLIYQNIMEYSAPRYTESQWDSHNHIGQNTV